MAEPVAEVHTFPTDISKFDNDERISFSKLDNKYIAVQNFNGAEFEFDPQLRRWLPIADEEEEVLIQRQKDAYFLNHEEAPYASSGGAANSKKRKKDASNGSEDQDDKNGPPARKSKKQAKAPPQPKQNTAIYVTGLPPDATVDEVSEVFSRKCGVIAEEIDSGRPRIKLYTDSDGNFKGDALVVFFKPQSVEMAIMLLDDTDFRFTSSGLSTGKMRVQAAESSYKKTQYENNPEDDKTAVEGVKAGGNGVSRPKPPNKPNHKDREKIIKKTQKMDAKLADWSDDEPSSLATEPAKRDKMVILKHMFTLEELNEDPAALLEIKEDIRDECEKLGEVTNVILYDQEEDGVVSVKFKTVDSAEACVKLMDGRAFAGQKVEAYFASAGKEKFRKSKKGGEQDESGD